MAKALDYSRFITLNFTNHENAVSVVFGSHRRMSLGSVASGYTQRPLLSTPWRQHRVVVEVQLLVACGTEQRL